MANKDYGINDIETLSFKDGVRKRIAMYLGSADMQGVYNAIQEIISNSIDEFYMGFGSKIEIGLNGNLVRVRDYGRGVPFGIKEDGSNTLVDIFSKARFSALDIGNIICSPYLFPSSVRRIIFRFLLRGTASRIAYFFLLR